VEKRVNEAVFQASLVVDAVKEKSGRGEDLSKGKWFLTFNERRKMAVVL
jgi:hypothetical protein